MPDEHYVVTTVEFPRCKTKQKIRVAVRAGFSQMADESIPCLKCDKHFKVTIPDRVIRGPFPR